MTLTAVPAAVVVVQVAQAPDDVAPAAGAVRVRKVVLRIGNSLGARVHLNQAFCALQAAGSRYKKRRNYQTEILGRND